MRQVQEQLNTDLVGLPEAKAELQALIANVVVDAEREEAGMRVPNRTRHLIFAGNPGTGKTTFADGIAKIYHALNVVPKDKVSRVTGVDLISPYENGTPKRVKEKFEAAKGGVLFIDEAYGMVTGQQNEAGQQAVDTLNELITANPDTVVIMAGYPDRLNEIFALNEGMARRFPTTITFSNFSAEDRRSILRAKMDKDGFTFGSGEQGKRAKSLMLDALLDTGDGNAGDVENLWSKVLQAHSARIAPLLASSKDKQALLRRLTAEDVQVGHDMFVAQSRVENPIRQLVAVPNGRKRS